MSVFNDAYHFATAQAFAYCSRTHQTAFVRVMGYGLWFCWQRDRRIGCAERYGLSPVLVKIGAFVCKPLKPMKPVAIWHPSDPDAIPG